MAKVNHQVLKTILLLIMSNTFMTFAWYGHLKFRQASLVLVIFASWGIAFFEYCFQVPANRVGAERLTVTQLKIVQECITLLVFSVIAYLMFREPLHWRNLVSYALIVVAVYFAFLGERKEPEVDKAIEASAMSPESKANQLIVDR